MKKYYSLFAVAAVIDDVVVAIVIFVADVVADEYCCSKSY